MRREDDKVMVVEGKTDREKLLSLLEEPVEVLCTHGTLGVEQLEELIVYLENKDVYILVDADDAGNKLRNQLEQELPNATHLFIRKMHKEVARTPDEELIRILENAHFLVSENFLFRGD